MHHANRLSPWLRPIVRLPCPCVSGIAVLMRALYELTCRVSLFSWTKVWIVSCMYGSMCIYGMVFIGRL